MVVCTLHILSLKDEVKIPAFLAKLRESRIEPVIKARVLRWMILPTTQSAGHLLGRNTKWDLLIGLAPGSSIPETAMVDIDETWTASCGVSSSVLSGYKELSAKLISSAPAPLPLPKEQKDSSQNLEVSSELLSWIAAQPESVQNHPVSMLNLLAFNPEKKPQYQEYGREFSRRVGSAFGGRVKIAARLVGGESQAERNGWHEVAYVHYPSLSHFSAMAASTEYQEVNKKYRLGALKDTFILCVVEIDDHGELAGNGRKGKL